MSIKLLEEGDFNTSKTEGTLLRPDGPTPILSEPLLGQLTRFFVLIDPVDSPLASFMFVIILH